jgi:hypothetical protein
MEKVKKEKTLDPPKLLTPAETILSIRLLCLIIELKTLQEVLDEREGVSMLEITEKATEKLKDYLQERELDSAIRIFVSQIG